MDIGTEHHKSTAFKKQKGTQPLSKSLVGQLGSIGKFFIRPVFILREYRIGYLKPDLIAAVTVAVIMLPQAIAFALVAELPPLFGLSTAIFASIVAGLWGSSNQLQTGPVNTISILTLSTLLAVAAPGTTEYMQAARLLAIMAGIIALILGLAKLGVLVNFISDSVIVGFTAGAGILIIVGQLRHLLGIDIPSSPQLFEIIKTLGLNISETHWLSLGIGLLTIAILVVLKRVSPKLPAALIAIVITAFLVATLSLKEEEVQSVKEISATLPPVFPLPNFNPKLIAQLSTKALAVAAIGLVQSMSIARMLSSQTRQRLDSNQEFVGQGLGNIVSGIFSGYPATGSFSRSAVNYQSGAQTSLASVFAGLLVLIAILTMSGLVVYIPLATLAGILIVIAYRLIDFKEMTRIWQSSKGDRLIMLVTFVATLTIPLEFAVLLGVAMSLVYYLLQTSTPRVRSILPNKKFEYFTPEDGREACPQLGVIEILGDLYFGAVHHVEDFIHENILEHPSQRYLLLRMHNVENIDISGIHVLESIAELYRKRGGDIFFEHYRQPVIALMRSSGFVKFLGEENFIPRETDAIAYLFYKILDPAICIYECPYRVFKECQNLPKRLDLIGDDLHLRVSSKDLKYISAKDLWKIIHSDQPPIIFDVREPREYNIGHIPTATLKSLPSLLSNLTQVPRNKVVVLVCRSGRRSERVASLLQEHGYKNIRVLEGGILSWETANLLEAVNAKATQEESVVDTS